MSLSQKILSTRKAKGITQEALAEATKVSIRTIQRLESGESIPRSFTLKRISEALEIPFEDLNIPEASDLNATTTYVETVVNSESETKYFLRLICLSCFSYIVIPYVHFLIPMYLLKKKLGLSEKGKQFSRQVIFSQIYWVIGMILLFLLALIFNFIQACYFNRQYLINYIWVFVFIYLLNVFIISIWIKRINQFEEDLANK